MNNTKTLFIFAIFVFFLPYYFSSNAVTISPGLLPNATFSPTGNIYLIEKDLVIPKDETVTIPKGSIFLFNPYTGIRVYGTLFVEGTKDTPVVFTSINDTNYNENSMRPAAPFDWNGITFHKDATRLKMDYFFLSHSVYGIRSESADIDIANAIFSDNGQYHFTVQGKIMNVKEGICFSFRKEQLDSSAQNESTMSTLSVPGFSKAPFNSQLRISDILGSNHFRYSTLCLGSVGIGVGIYYAVKAGQCQNILKNMSIRQTALNKSSWDRNRDMKWQYITRSTLAFIGGGIALSGFGLSFVF
jgi:hypothetical protein